MPILSMFLPSFTKIIAQHSWRWFKHIAVLALSPPRCAACSEFLEHDAVFCASCVITLEIPPKLPTWVTASFAYGGALADVIRALKYDSRTDLIRPLCRLICERLPNAESIDVVVAVPASLARLRSRGFDQAALLANAVASTLHKPLRLNWLTRIVDTPRLATLNKEERAQAIQGAFKAKNIGFKRILLVDDVYTTGATLFAAAKTLEAQGAQCYGHVLAATPTYFNSVNHV